MDFERTGESECPAVGCEPDPAHARCARVAEAVQLAPGGHVVDDGLSALANRGQLRAVVGVGDVEDGAAALRVVGSVMVVLPAAQLPAGGDVPDLNRSVPTSGGDRLAVGGEGDMPNALSTAQPGR